MRNAKPGNHLKLRETNKIMYFIVVTIICIPINAHTDLQIIFYLKVQTISTRAHVLSHSY